MWVPERVWEQHLVSAIAEAGIEYTVLDDFHFQRAGVTGDDLFGYYLTEDEGRLLKIFPGSETLRYTMPFQEPHATYEFLRRLARAEARGHRRLRRRRREVRKLARYLRSCLHARLAEPVLRHDPGQPRLARGDHAGPGGGRDASPGQGLCARRLLPRDDRVGAPPCPAPGLRARQASRRGQPAGRGDQALLPRGRLLAELQGALPRERRDVRPDARDLAQAGRRREPGRTPIPTTWRSPAGNSIAASATAPTGMAPSAGFIFPTFATPSTTA